MLHHARLARQMLADRALDVFMTDETAKLAVVRCVEVIGEAGHQVSSTTQAALPTVPTVPWRLMWGMRNRLIHDYGNTDHRILHNVVIEELPTLAAVIEAFLAQEI